MSNARIARIVYLVHQCLGHKTIYNINTRMFINLGEYYLCDTTLNQVYSETYPKDDSKNVIVAKGMRSLGKENKMKKSPS